MPQEIIDFWFSEEVSKLWYDSTPEFDQLLCERFESVWEQARAGELLDAALHELEIFGPGAAYLADLAKLIVDRDH